jgi:hypothetical protein
MLDGLVSTHCCLLLITHLGRVKLDFLELGDEGEEEGVEGKGHDPLADGAADVEGPPWVSGVPLGRILA